MKRHRHPPEQAVRTLREGERMLAESKDLTEVLRHLENLGRSMGADAVVACLKRLVAERGAPKHLRMDSGPELIAWRYETGAVSPGSAPAISNQARHGRTSGSNRSTDGSGDELLNIEEFGSLTEARGGSNATPVVPTASPVVSPRRLRCHLDPQNPRTTPITGGPTTEVPSVEQDRYRCAP